MARSQTCMLSPAMHFMMRLKSFGIRCSMAAGSATSIASNNSAKNNSSFSVTAKGQYFSKVSIRGTAKLRSFVKKSMVHLMSCSKNYAFVCTLCNGKIMLWKKLMCSCRMGMA